MWSQGNVLGGKYRIVESLGSGGMGEVFLAEHCFLEKQVAIKFLHPVIAEDQDAVNRFYREAQAAAALRHRGIVEVYDVGWDENGSPYIIMEHLVGESLEAAVASKGGHLDHEEAGEVAVQILSVLATVHERNIIHRDLKPGNIFLCPSPSPVEEGKEVKLLDFGVSKILDGESGTKLTQAGEILGSVPYMAPEQALGESDVDHRVDLWGVGAILYETLTGALPFPGDRPRDVLVAIVNGPLTLPREVRPDLPAAYDAILAKALTKDPGLRYPSASEFMSDIIAVLGAAERAKQVASAIPSSDDATLTGLEQVATQLERITGRGGSVSATPAPAEPPARRTASNGEEKVHSLHVVRGLDTGGVLRVDDGGVLVGRDEECDLTLIDESVSRRHAFFSVKGADLVVEDLASSNGVAVNGVRSSRAVLRAGDQILLGMTTILKYEVLDKARVEHHEQVYESIAFDTLTRALNRRSMDRHLAADWSYARRNNEELSVLAVDIDRFGEVNSRFGDPVGDDVLKHFARMVRSTIRGEDVFARYGGDLFLVSSMSVGHKGAARLARRLRKAVAKHRFEAGGETFKLTISAGVATLRGSRKHSVDELVAAAGKRLASAKRAGGNKDQSS